MGFLVDNVPGLKPAGRSFHAGPCPICGGTDRFVVKQFEDGREGWICRQCSPGSYHTPENYLVERFGISYEQARSAIESGGYAPTTQRPAPSPAPAPAHPAEPPRRVPYWQKHADRLQRGYVAHPDRHNLWQAYKPLPEATIEKAGLGVGKLMSNKCQHDRLIVPVWNDFGRIVCFRGRRIDCDCTDDRGKLLNWTTSAGWNLYDLPLYNAPRPGQQAEIIWVVENQIDALMVDAFTTFRGVATMSTSYWRDAWTDALVEASPKLVIVAYDNDLPGNGGGQQREAMIKKWRLTAPAGAPLPIAHGQVLANILLEAGLPAVLYDWQHAQAGDDIGSILARFYKETHAHG